MKSKIVAFFGLLFFTVTLLFLFKKRKTQTLYFVDTPNDESQYQYVGITPPAVVETPSITYAGTGPLVWGNFANTNEVSNYVAYTSGTGNTGAKATLPIDATQAFQLVIDYDSEIVTRRVLVCLDDEAGTGYTSANTFVTGVYQAGEDVYIDNNYNTESMIDLIPAFPAKVKLSKSGNNVVYSVSTNAGVSYSAIYTHAGVLAGKTTLYVKAMFLAPLANQKIKVSKL